MNKEQEKAVLEAILFTMGDAVETERLAAVLEKEKDYTRELLLELQAEYEGSPRGMTLIELEDSFQMCTKSSMYEYLVKIAKTPRKYVITDTMLETLSIIAYKQPITRAEIEKVRGVSCDHAVNRLLEFGLITELGRKDAPGRPLLFGTTEEFLRTFGVKSLEELPELTAVQIEEFRAQAEAEAGNVNLDI
ncbi:MAG: SMC-Scp complex subunit ScpB [Lachnospiraceae bacterium]|nr:SMC-Scp complex subunit ScpB [Lachnospiraceae bacterium]